MDLASPDEFGAEWATMMTKGKFIPVVSEAPGIPEEYLQLLGSAAVFLLINITLRLEPFAEHLLLLLRQDPHKLDAGRRRELIHRAAFKITGHLHNCVAVPLALYVLSAEPELRDDPFHATSPASHGLAVWSTGYFIHEILMVIAFYDLEGFGFLVHGFFCSAIFTYGVLRKQGIYFAASFIVWEASSPFVHLRWFLYEMGLKESKLYFLNGIAMIIVFFLFRNVMGIYSSMHFWEASARELASSSPDAFPPYAVCFFRVANMSLNLLNLFWLTKMVSGAAKAILRRRGNDNGKRLTAKAE